MGEEHDERRPGAGRAGPLWAHRAHRARRWRLGFCATAVSTGAADLLEPERVLVAGALPARRAEFATGRWCAHAALAQVGAQTAEPLLQDPRGAPRWPAGVVGAITHTTGWTGAVVARTGWRHGVRAVGLDAEVAAPLPAGVLDVVASPAERADLEHLAAADPATPWDGILFTAKEASYKAWYPLGGAVLAHDDVEVHLSGDGRFTAVARGRTGASRPTVRAHGRWARGPGVVVSLAVVD